VVREALFRIKKFMMPLTGGDDSMADVTITVRPNGPYVIQGAVRIVDPDGNEFPVDLSKPIALCRCGASQRRPFCDGAHKSCGFQGVDRAQTPKQ
jgi:CDGSH-type Zn-finger protein